MTRQYPRSGQSFRLAALTLGGLLLIWLPIEDTQETLAILFASAICALLAWRVLSPHALANWLRYLSVGLLAGLAVSPIALFLMAFKTGAHGHGVPDFTPAQIASVIQRTPIFILGGVLVASGYAAWRAARR